MERETTPSQSEWMIMEVFWANETPTMTAEEVIRIMQSRSLPHCQVKNSFF